MDKHTPREEAFVLHLVERLKLELAKEPWNPNAEKCQTGADIALLLTDGRRIGIQVTEIDPFPKPGARGRERSQVRTSASGVYGNYVQNDAGVILEAICRAIDKKVLTIPDQSLFDEVWLLICAGVPDAPCSTFIRTGPLSPGDLNATTADQLRGSRYTKCFLMPIFGTEGALYKWSESEPNGWNKAVYLEEIPIGTAADAEYVRELLCTHGKDKSVVDAQVKRSLAEIRAASSASGTVG